MVKRRPPAAPKRPRITGERAGRLYKLLLALESGAQLRAPLVKRLRIGLRTFYRDVDLLRECGVTIETAPEGYILQKKLDEALHSLPFPDPELTFGDLVQLMKGRSKAHKKLRSIFERITA